MVLSSIMREDARVTEAIIMTRLHPVTHSGSLVAGARAVSSASDVLFKVSCASVMAAVDERDSGAAPGPSFSDWIMSRKGEVSGATK